MRMEKPIGTLRSKSDSKILGVESYANVKEEQFSEKSDNMSLKTGKSGFIIENELVSDNSELSDNQGQSEFDQKSEKPENVQKRLGSLSRNMAKVQNGQLGSRAELFQRNEPK